MVKNIVALYVPNIIGYFRIFLILFALVYFSYYPVLSVIFLLFSEFLDLVDGVVATKLNQCSNYGAVLDYVVDRLFYIVVAVLLINLYSNFLITFTLILMVDIASHLARVYMTIYSGGIHHKFLSSDFKVLQLYYSPSKHFMRATILFYDAFFLLLLIKPCLYLGAFFWALLLLSLPGFLMKILVHVLQLIECFTFLANNHNQVAKNE